MKILEQLADDLISAIDDPIEIAEELTISDTDLYVLRSLLIQRISELGPELTEWIVGWQGRSIRKILRILDLPNPSPNTPPAELVKIWLEHRGVKLPIPQCRPQQLYRIICELIEQFTGVGGHYGLIWVVIPAIEQLFRLLIIYYIQGIRDETEIHDIFNEYPELWEENCEFSWNSMVNLLECLNIKKLAVILASFNKVYRPPYTSLSNNTICLISTKESCVLKKLSQFANHFEKLHISDREVQEFFNLLCAFLDSWKNRFDGLRSPVPIGNVIYSVSEGMYCCFKFRCRDEQEKNVLIDGVEQKLSVETELLLEALDETKHWGDQIKPLPRNDAWITPDINLPNFSRKGLENWNKITPKNERTPILYKSNPKVFISYSREDSQIAEKIVKALREDGIEITMDILSMKVGQNILDFIFHSIKETDITLSIVSNRSLLSTWVAMETIDSFYQEKFTNSKKFIACYIDDDFLESDFRIKATEQIDNCLKKMERKSSEYNEMNIDTIDLNEEKTRLYKLRSNLGEILVKLRNTLTIDISNERFEENIIRIIEAIKSHGK